VTSFYLGPWLVQVELNRLSRNGQTVHLEPKVMRVLVRLAESPGVVINKEELIRSVWSDTFVTDDVLTRSISELRKAFEDDPRQPKFIETIPRSGYRLVIPIRNFGSEPGVAPLSEVVTKWRFDTFRRGWSLVAIGTAIVVLFGLGGWHVRRKPLEAHRRVELVPLTVLPGKQYSPAFSPDGNQIAFVNDDGDNSGIYITMIGGERQLRLTTYGSAPTWSPDGRQIAFLRLSHDMESNSIYIVPSLGGTPRRVYSGPIDLTFMHGLSWSPNGEVLAFAQRDPDDIHAWISLLSLSDGSTRKLTSPSGQDHDFLPAFSPDGTTVAFVRGSTAGVVNDVFVVPATGGASKRLTFDDRVIFGLAWTPDGRDLIFSSARGGAAFLWRVPASGGTPQPFADVTTMTMSLTISPKGSQAAFQHVAAHDTVWRIELADEKRPRGPSQLVIGMKGRNCRPNFSPDGKKIAFESEPAGNQGPSEIWTCDSDGGNCAQLTSLHGTAATPRWSPDGRHIAFEFHPQARSEVYVVDLEGGPPRLVPTFAGADNLAPNWSRDGKWIYFASNRGGHAFQLWKVPVTGGIPVAVTKDGGIYCIESADGRYLYYAKFEVPGIWKIPENGGEETRVLDQSGSEGWSSWALTEKGIYFVSIGAEHRASLAYFEFATHQISSITAMDKPPSVGLAISPDGRSILYVQNEFSESDIMLVKNLH
jgi:Tol biopolymer transport system component/DNA-binding winged helix-turn-helix (wHTH) protein